MAMYVCLFVHPVQTFLEQSIFIFLGQSALRERSISNQELRVIPLEPKILRLVHKLTSSTSKEKQQKQ